MSEQIVFFEKNKLDISESAVTITASQGQSFVDFVRNRSNNSSWQTTGSVDADNTTFEIDFVDEREIDTIILIEHNLKAYTIQYWDGAAYQNFSASIAETTNTATTTRHEFTDVSTTKIKLTITGTMIADDDKRLAQFIATQTIGQLQGWPIISKPTVSRNRINNKMLSGKLNVNESVGGFSFNLDVGNWNIDADLDIIESLYSANEGFLVWLCGGDVTQFSHERAGYRLKDTFLVKCVDEYQPEWYKGLYKSGLKISISMAEVID